MRINKQRGIITMPKAPRARSITTWAAEVMVTLRQLRDRPVETSSTNRRNPPHPFKLETIVEDDTLKLRAYFGQVQRTTVYPDSAGADILAFSHVGVAVGLGEMVGDPDGSIGAGTIDLSLSTTYGVWLKVPSKKSGWEYFVPPGDETIDATLVEFAETSSASIVVDSTNTERGDADLMTASTSGFAYVYVGKVTVDADGIPTISQHLKSDVLLPASLYTGHILSGDNSNNNAIVIGTDKGLYLDPESFVVSITGGTDISVADDGGGSFTINFTG